MLEVCFHNFDVSFFINKFPILHLNNRSASYKIDDLSVWLTRLINTPDVICLSEIWFDTAHPVKPLAGYNFVNVDCISGEEEVEFACTSGVR